MKSKIIHSTESQRIEHFYHDDSENINLAFIFSPSMNRSLDGSGYGGEVFLRNGYDTIHFKVSNDDWFQSVPSDIFDEIKNIVAKKKYKNKIAYGSSMGGYASIAFSKLLDCNTAIAFSPQYSITEPFDRRWEAFAKKINFKYPISSETVSSSCKFFIFYDNKDPDELHIAKLLKVIPADNIFLIKLPYAGHPSTYYLAEVGIIKDIIAKVVKDNNVDGIDFLSNKKSSKSYLVCLSQHLNKKIN